MPNDQQITSLLSSLQRSLDEAGLAGGGRFSGGLTLGAADQPVPAGGLLLEGSIYRSTALAARLLKTADQTLASGVTALISFSAVSFDPAGMFDPAAPERLTARHAGVYWVSAGLGFALNPAGHRQAALRLNGFETLAAHTLMSPGGADGWLTLSGLANLAEGEYAELTGLQTSGGDLDVRAASWLGMVRLA
jgi:hypothetical protein